MTKNIFFCGTGGQGVLKAAEICGWAAVFEGYHVKKSEVHGMAQRGGSVESHIRFGKKVYSPLIPKGFADFLVSFDEGEHERLKYFLRNDGKDLFGFLEIAKKSVENKKIVNTFLLGVLSSFLEIKEENWTKAFEKVLKGKYLEENKEIFKKGRSIKL